jgi:hypothetical protein
MLQQLPCCAVLCCAVLCILVANCVFVLQDSDSAGQKLGGALLNAIIFMAECYNNCHAVLCRAPGHL